MNNTSIVEATEGHLEAIARCHQAAFPRSFSSALGLSFLKRMLGWYLSGPKTFLFFVQQEAACLGYCGGMMVDGIQHSGSATGMAQHSFWAAVRALLVQPWLLFHPELVSKYRFVLKNVVRRIGRSAGLNQSRQHAFCQEPHVGLVVIGVDPAVQGQGIGSMLLDHFEIKARDYGVKKMMLTVLPQNQQAIAAYRKKEWLITSHSDHSVTMEKEII